MTPADLKDKKVIVMGLGVNRGGVGATKWLMKHGARVLITDLASERTLADSIADIERFFITENRKRKGKVHRPEYALDGHREEDFASADMILKNPAVPRESVYLKVAKKAGVPVESDVSIFFRMNPHPVIGVTGSKGKTTVTILLGDMLKRKFGRAFVAGNLGKSPLDGLDALAKAKTPKPILLELSSWGLETLKPLKKSPHIAVLTNLFPEHLNRYRGMEDYAAAKELIFRFQGPHDLAFVPFRTPLEREVGRRVLGRRVWIGEKAPAGDANAAYLEGTKAVLRIDGKATVLFHTSDLRVPGAHTLVNALIAAAVAYTQGVNLRAIRSSIRAFKGIPHRLEQVKEARGITWWNDSAATHPVASVAGMSALSRQRRLVLIAGGSDKALDFGPWAKAVKRYARDVVLLEGTATPKIMHALASAGVEPAAVVTSMASAVLRANVLARARDVVLLSPGATSFGLFLNEFDRGDRFRKAVRRYAR